MIWSVRGLDAEFMMVRLLAGFGLDGISSGKMPTTPNRAVPPMYRQLDAQAIQYLPAPR